MCENALLSAADVAEVNTEKTTSKSDTKCWQHRYSDAGLTMRNYAESNTDCCRNLFGSYVGLKHASKMQYNDVKSRWPRPSRLQGNYRNIMSMYMYMWLGSRVVSMLDSGAEGSGFTSQPQRCRVTVLGKLFTPIVHQAAKLVAALLRVAGVTAGLAESNGSLPSGLRFTSPAGWLPRTGISAGTLRSIIEYGLPLPLYIYMLHVEFPGYGLPCDVVCMVINFAVFTER